MKQSMWIYNTIIFVLFQVTFIVCLIGSTVSFANDLCPLSENFITAEIESTVERLKDGKYKYSYSISNLGGSKLPLKIFMVETNKLHEDVKNPEHWKVMDWGESDSEFLKWSRNLVRRGDVEVGSSLKGFEFISTQGPGIAKFRTQGTNYRPFKTQNVSEQHVLTLCPGMYQDGSTIPGNESIQGLTFGPLPANRKSAELRIRRANGKANWTGEIKATEKELLSFSPLEKGKIEVALLGNENLTPESVAVSTIEFGRGKASPIKVGISDCEISSSKSVKALVMTFNLEDVNVLCNADQAIFLTAKTKTGNDILGGVKIQATECNQANWQREAKKMIDAGELDLPEGKYKIK